MTTKNPFNLLAQSLLLISIIILAGCNHFKSTEKTTEIDVTSKKTAHITGVTPDESAVTDNSVEITPTNLWSEIAAGYGLPQVDDAKVSKHLRWFSNNQRYIDRIGDQSAPYLHYVVNQLRENNMPLELALLPIVESAYDPFVVSPSKAAGVWQFVPMTGRNFGLKQNNWYDGRRDIVASTDAAIRYLKRLNTMFDGDWLLAIAAYNAGEGTVGRAVARNRKAKKPTDFWSLSLSKQTTSYVPQLIALSKVVAAPEKYELTLKEIPNTPYFTTVNVNSAVDLAQAARMINIEPKELRRLNAGYSRWITDTSGAHQLLVPIDEAANFSGILDQLPKIAPVTISQDYRVKSGDTLGAIAKRFHTTTAAISSVNGLKNSNLRIGQALQIPGQATLISPYAAEAEKEIRQQQHTIVTPRYYTVKSGDSFWVIAKKENTSVQKLLQLNTLSGKTKLKPGQKLIVSSMTTYKKDGNKITYQIQHGDTLVKIANRFEVSKKDLLAWNQVKDESYIHPGQELTIYLTASN